MKKFNVARALKDKSFREGLSQEQKAVVGNPVGIAEIDDSLLLNSVGAAGGGTHSYTSRTAAPTWCCACTQ
jgi:hypothetical protein